MRAEGQGPNKSNSRKFKIVKATCSNRSLEQRMTIAKISLYCILKNEMQAQNERVKARTKC